MCIGKRVEESVYILLYVDDMLIVIKDKKKVLKFSYSDKEFEMKYLGLVIRIFGMEIYRDKEKGILKLFEERYVK